MIENGVPNFAANRRCFLRCGGALSLVYGLSNPPCAFSQTISDRWIREQIRRPADPICGSEIRQLTSAVAISHNIYGEQLYCSANGTRIAFLRCATSDHRDGPMELFVTDLHQKGVRRMGKAAFFLVGGNGRNDELYYVRQPSENKKNYPVITRLNFSSLEQTDLFGFGDCPVPQFRGLLAVNPEGRFCMILRRLGKRRYGIERIDLEKGTWELIHEQDDIFNAHLQYNPAGGEVMVQHNRGGLLDENFNQVRASGPEGSTLYIVSEDGKKVRPLPVGTPHTVPVSGHECWVGETGHVLFTARGGKVYLAQPDAEKPTLIATGAGFVHLTASPDGKFYVVDSIGTGRLFLGCIATRKVLPLCDTGASGASPQYTHTHPYITPGNHRVVFNSDRTGIPQVYTARIPEDLLQDLEA